MLPSKIVLVTSSNLSQPSPSSWSKLVFSIFNMQWRKIFHRAAHILALATAIMYNDYMTYDPN